MKLKEGHLYKVAFPNSKSKKKYILISPTFNFNTDKILEGNGFWLACIICTTKTDNFYSGIPLYFSSREKYIFEKPTVNNVFEIIRKMKENGGKFRYNFKTGKVERKEKIKLF